MRALRRDILRLIQTYIEKETNFTQFHQNFMPSLTQLMEDYLNSDAHARDPETLMLFATILKKDGEHMAQSLGLILNNLCQPTLNMIQVDYIAFPDFREGFFKLVHNIITHCTQGLIALGLDSFGTIFETLLFGSEHLKPEVMEISLKAIWDLNDRIMAFQQVSEIFYCQFYTSFMKRMLTTMTDCQHLSGFKLQCKIIQQLIQAIETNGLITQPIHMNSQPHTYPSNKAFVIELLINTILELFPNLNKMWVETLSNRFFNTFDDWKAFKGAVRDLMVSMRSFSA